MLSNQTTPAEKYSNMDYCKKCSAELTLLDINDYQVQRLECDDCGAIHYFDELTGLELDEETPINKITYLSIDSNPPPMDTTILIVSDDKFGNDPIIRKEFVRSEFYDNIQSAIEYGVFDGYTKWAII